MEDIDEYLIEEYGQDFLYDKSEDDILYSMDSFDEFFEGVSPLEAVTRTFYGGRYKWDDEPFNPNDEYFYINAYGNYYSVNEYDKLDYLQSCIGYMKEEFIEWLKDNHEDDYNEYFGEEEEDEEEDE